MAAHHHDHQPDDPHAGHSHAGHSHSHGPTSFGAAFAIGASANAAFVAVQIMIGVVAHSNALLADAIHNLGDVLGLLLSWAAAWAGGRAPSRRRTYGWGRVSILAALVNAVILLVGVGAIGLEAARRFAEPAAVQGGLVMAVATVGIFVNGATAWLFARGRDDLNVRAAFLHLAADALVSLGVVLAAGLILLTGWSWIDPLASLAIAAVILVGTWGTLTQAADLAVDAVPIGISPRDVQACLARLPNVVEVHDLHIWALSTTRTALTVHLVVAGAASHVVGMACRELHDRFGIDHATVQVEDEKAAVDCALRSEAVI